MGKNNVAGRLTKCGQTPVLYTYPAWTFPGKRKDNDSECGVCVLVWEPVARRAAGLISRRIDAAPATARERDPQAPTGLDPVASSRASRSAVSGLGSGRPRDAAEVREDGQHVASRRGKVPSLEPKENARQLCHLPWQLVLMITPMQPSRMGPGRRAPCRSRPAGRLTALACPAGTTPATTRGRPSTAWAHGRTT